MVRARHLLFGVALSLAIGLVASPLRKFPHRNLYVVKNKPLEPIILLAEVLLLLVAFSANPE